MYKALQIPAIAGTAPPADDPFLGEVTASWQQLVADGGLTLYADWASPSMYDTLAKYYQEAMAGKTSPADAAKAIQADWSKFDAHDCRRVERRTRRARDDRPPRERSLPGRRRRAAATAPGAPGEPRNVAWLYILPGLAFFLLFTFAPLLHAAWLSLYQWDGLTVGKFVGLDNYSQALHDPDVRTAFGHALPADHLLLVVPVVLGLALTGFDDAASRCAASRSSAPCCSCRR